MECQKYFGVQANEAIIQSDQVSCITEFSQVLPLENGEIYVSLTDGRELIGEDFKNWTLATNIRLRLIQTKTMLSHLTSIAVGDLNVLRRVKHVFLHFIHWLVHICIYFSITTASKKLLLVVENNLMKFFQMSTTCPEGWTEWKRSLKNKMKSSIFC